MRADGNWPNQVDLEDDHLFSDDQLKSEVCAVCDTSFFACRPNTVAGLMIVGTWCRLFSGPTAQSYTARSRSATLATGLPSRTLFTRN